MLDRNNFQLQLVALFGAVKMKKKMHYMEWSFVMNEQVAMLGVVKAVDRSGSIQHFMEPVSNYHDQSIETIMQHDS